MCIWIPSIVCKHKKQSVSTDNLLFKYNHNIRGPVRKWLVIVLAAKDEVMIVKVITLPFKD